MDKLKYNQHKKLIGMIHLPTLPGYPSHLGMDHVIKKALTDLMTLEKAGYDGVLVENDNDQPHQIGVNEEVKAAFKQVMLALREHTGLYLGMEIIYDMTATIEVAGEVGCDFIRLDVFVDNVETKWGKIPASADAVMEIRNKMKINLDILTDIHVKHAKMLDQKSLTTSAYEAIEKGSDGIIVTGTWTGVPPSENDCKLVKREIGDTPLFIGSGLTHENLPVLVPLVDGAIVGTSIKTGDYVDFDKAKKLAELLSSYNTD